MTRDLFGNILYHALQAKLDMGQALKYPLTPIPLSLCHPDGIMQKTPKSKLLIELERRVQPSNPEFIDVKIIDGMFFMHLFINLPSKFGDAAKCILQQLCKQAAKEIHLVFDKTISPSIKDCERSIRGHNRESMFQITGPEQKRPSNWLHSLRIDQFKEALVQFLTTFWDRNDFAFIIGQKKLFGDMCFLFRTEDGVMVKSIAHDYICRHEEADSRMFFHLSKCQAGLNIVLRSIDTDVLIIALGSFSSLCTVENDKKIWMETGLSTKNTLRYTNINQIHNCLGEKLCMSLSAFHAFTGCDYTAAFNRKGKVRPLRLLEKDESVQLVFSKLHEWNSITNEDIKIVEGFVCGMYGDKKFQSVDDLHLEMFLKKYKPKNGSLVDNMMRMDSSSLPPCSKVLYEKLKRSSYVARLWKNCLLSDAQWQDVLSFGWKMEGRYYGIQWFVGDSAPKIVNVVRKSEGTALSMFEYVLYFINIKHVPNMFNS